MLRKGGFTLIELLVVIVIIGLLASIALISVNNVRKNARDARRLSDMKQIVLALGLYLDRNDRYPNNTDDDHSGWDVGFNGGPGSGDPFIQSLETDGLMSKVPGDPISTGFDRGYHYHRYPPGGYGYGCDTSKGFFYVLGVKDMETSGRPHPDSPGWACGSRDWQGEFDWVIGAYEK